MDVQSRGILPYAFIRQIQVMLTHTSDCIVWKQYGYDRCEK